MRIPIFLVLLTFSSTVFAAQTRDDYISYFNTNLDALIASSNAIPKQTRLHFAANLFFAHEVAIAGTPLPTLIKKVEALHEAGINRVDIQMGLFPFLNNNAGVIAK